MKARDEQDDFLDYVKRLIVLARKEKLLQLQVGEVNIVLSEPPAGNTQAIGFSFPDIDPDDEEEEPELVRKARRRGKSGVKKKRR